MKTVSFIGHSVILIYNKGVGETLNNTPLKLIGNTYKNLRVEDGMMNPYGYFMKLPEDK